MERSKKPPSPRTKKPAGQRSKPDISKLIDNYLNICYNLSQKTIDLMAKKEYSKEVQQEIERQISMLNSSSRVLLLYSEQEGKTMLGNAKIKKIDDEKVENKLEEILLKLNG